MLAARGRRALEGEALPEEARGQDERWLAAQSRRRARGVVAWSVAIGVALTAALTLLHSGR